jgi:hypothetical protein
MNLYNEEKAVIGKHWRRLDRRGDGWPEKSH